MDAYCEKYRFLWSFTLLFGEIARKQDGNVKGEIREKGEDGRREFERGPMRRPDALREICTMMRPGVEIQVTSHGIPRARKQARTAGGRKR